MRGFSIPDHLEAAIENALNSLDFSLSRPQEIIPHIRRLSDMYTQSRELVGIWRYPELQAAYLSYFFPLNLVRLLAVINEGERLRFFKGLKGVVDFGSGPGTFHLASGDLFTNWQFIETSSEAIGLHQKLAGVNSQLDWQPHFAGSLRPHSLVSMSYAFNELDTLPEWMLKAEALLIVEPSTQEHGRRLLELRQDLMDNGFFMWAPCTHQQVCPLLVESKRDWCHDRIFLKQPAWFAEIEKHLPMKNRSLTFSYLLARKTRPSVQPGLTRVIGDTLFEKGKTKQMICRGPEREFLSWLKKEGEAPHLDHGILISLPDCEKKGNELRPKNNIEVLS